MTFLFFYFFILVVFGVIFEFLIFLKIPSLFFYSFLNLKVYQYFHIFEEETWMKSVTFMIILIRVNVIITSTFDFLLYQGF